MAINIQIRIAQERDYRFIVDLLYKVYKEELGSSDNYVNNCILPIDKYSKFTGLDIIVAVYNNIVVGVIFLAGFNSYYADIAFPNERELRLLAVHKDYRRMGIAEQLINYAINLSISKYKIFKIVLSVLVNNRNPHYLYNKLGFQHIENRDWGEHGYKLHVLTKILQ